MLYRNHGLTLQQHKTAVYKVDAFKKRYLATPLTREMDALRRQFVELITALNLKDPYEHIEYDQLNEDQKKIIDSLNLIGLLKKELSKTVEPDFPVVQFILRRLAQLGDPSIIDLILNNIDKLHPIFPDIIKYLKDLSGLSPGDRKKYGARILDLLEDSILNELEYHRMWGMELFASSTEWNNEDRFDALLTSSSGLSIRRKIILAMGRAGHRHWFQSQWRTLFDEPNWTRRAVIAGASCMARDARKHWS